MHDVRDPWETVFETLSSLRDRWPGPPSGWGYDRRLKCVMASFSAEASAAAEAAIALAMPRFYSAETLGAATEAARSTAELCGGLRAAQRMYWGGEQPRAGAAGVGGGAFGLWWPWADGTTVSLRIGLHDVDLPKERYPRLRELFGILQAATPG
jgi:hypothetical protein